MRKKLWNMLESCTKHWEVQIQEANIHQKKEAAAIEKLLFEFN